MKKILTAAAILVAFQAPAQAEEVNYTQAQINDLIERVKVLEEFVKNHGKTERWAAIGIVETQIDGQEAEAKHAEFDNFAARDLCIAFIDPNSASDDYIGEGGTNNSMAKVNWNYDALCVQKSK